MFSKPVHDAIDESEINDTKCLVKANIIKTETINDSNKITCNLFFKNNIKLEKYKIPELKVIAKFNKLHISGNKPKLISRIEMHFLKEVNAIKIQKHFRKYIVNKLFKLRGDGFKNREKCVNATDFYTMEPLNEISHYLFFSYNDSNGFLYGFDITSLIHLIKYNADTPLINPYNREEIDNIVKGKIINLYNIIHIVFPYIVEDSIKLNTKSKIKMRNNRNSQTYNRSLNNNFEQTLTYDERTSLSNKMNEIRSKPIDVRVQELFIEIDLLGNYTQSSWFNDLSRSQYLRLYQWLYDIWNYRGIISRELRRMICSLNDPFIDAFSEIQYIDEITLERIKEACLFVFENMIYTGIDVEYRKIGTFHALSALTMVSYDARENLSWLYDSLI